MRQGNQSFLDLSASAALRAASARFSRISSTVLVLQTGSPLVPLTGGKKRAVFAGNAYSSMLPDTPPLTT